MSQKSITSATVQHIAQLANLTLTREEQRQLQKQLSEVLGFMDKLKLVDTKGVPVTSHVSGEVNVVRKDEKDKRALTVKKALSGAAQKEKKYFLTKNVFS